MSQRSRRLRGLSSASPAGAAILLAVAACGDDFPSTSSPDGDGGRDVSAPSNDSSVASADGGAPIHLAVDFSSQPANGYSMVPLGTIAVRVRDGAGQPVDATSVTLSLAAGGGPGTLAGTTTKITADGLATFDDLTISKAGSYTLVATTEGGGATAKSAPFNVSAWQPYSGNLVGGTVRRITVDPTDKDIAYATTDGVGVFRTTDGNHWTPVGFAGTYTSPVAVDPLSPTTIYVGLDQKGLYKSTDRGLTWTPVSAGYTTTSVAAIAIDKATPEVLYWGSEAGLLKSTNGGASWAPANDPAFATSTIMEIAIAPSNRQTIYVHPYGKQIYKSTNGGASWTVMSGLPSNVAARTLAVHPTDDSIVYVGFGESAGGLWRSTAGSAFTQIADTAPVSNGSVEEVVIVPGAPDTMYLAAYGANVFKSVDAGVTWTSLNDVLHGGNDPLALAMAPSDTNTLYVGHYVIDGGGFSKSTNGGATWNDASNGFVAFDGAGIAFDSVDGTLWAGGGCNGVHKSTDRGLSYSGIGHAEGLDWNGNFTIALSPAVAGTMFLGVNGGGLFKSTNAGASFTHETVLGNVALHYLAPSPVDANTIYVAGEYFGVGATANGGATWNTKTDGTYRSVGGIAAHPTVAATAYAGLNDGVYRTVDSGQSWTKLGAPAISQAHIAFDSAHHLLAAGVSGVQTSADGDNWTDITTSGGTPLHTEAAVTYLGSFKIGAEDIVFVGLAKQTGLWRRAGGTWASSFASAAILSMAQDPAHPSTLYAGIAGGGFYRTLTGGE